MDKNSSNSKNLEADQKQLDTWDYIKIKNKKVGIIKYYIQSKNINELSLHAANTSTNIVDLLKTCWTVYKKDSKHQPHEVTQFMKGKNSLYAQEKCTRTGNKVVMVDRLSQFSGKTLKLQRRWCWGLNVLSPNTDRRECWLLKDANILNWKKVRERAKWSNSKLHLLFYYEDNKILKLYSLQK